MVCRFFFFNEAYNLGSSVASIIPKVLQLSRIFSVTQLFDCTVGFFKSLVCFVYRWGLDKNVGGVYVLWLSLLPLCEPQFVFFIYEMGMMPELWNCEE